MMNPFKKFYTQVFTDKIFVVKASGRLITDQQSRENLIENIKELTENNIKILLIYGGGDAIDEAMEQANRTPTKIDGRRISSQDDIKIIKKTLAGDLGFKLSETMVKKNMNSTILNAIPPHWARSQARSDENGIKRYDGTLTKINKKNIRDHFISTNLAICPCLAFDDEGTALNINADNVAVELAAQTQADKLILMTNINGVMVNDELQQTLTAKEIEKLIADKIATDGMRVKLESCVHALRSGVRRVHIINGFRKNALVDEIYTKYGIGTMIVREEEKNNYINDEIKKES